MKRIFVLLVLVVYVFCLSSCNAKNAEQLTEISQEKIIYTEIDKTLEYNEIEDFLKKDNRMESFASEFGIKYFKAIHYSVPDWVLQTEGFEDIKDQLDFNEKTSEFESVEPYMVLKTDRGIDIAFFNFNKTFNYFVNVKFSEDEYEKELCDILESDVNDLKWFDIRKIDPSGQYPFLYTSWSGNPIVSCHYFASGNCYIIRYDNTEENVISVVKFTI